ncbi:adenylate/guanylate cyclase domain-containing protein [Roseibium polysiphoniae]|uniref:Adenylate/guanylate cyclase domain-containing protein n=1 Tax=Roseibium polysiphoniae TaxID=2571221 RepID=A0ABR9C4E4_9HYPH|nr:adenylate/guanylate cyclase domain-containing protein [Roseibium polysiphoniae]MBD8874704.1 adenylate/guanylate cyclase domain-containing protein [Roseibium polysiphoniae]
MMAQKPRRQGRPSQRLLVALAVGALAAVLSLPLASRLGPILDDLLVISVFGDCNDCENDIVLVTITEETLAQFPYRSPIDRGFLAELIETIDAASPQKIGLDVLIDGPSEPAKDKQLLDAIDRSSAPLILAEAGTRERLTHEQAAYLQAVISDRQSGSIVLQRDEADGVLRHLPRLEDESGTTVRSFAEALSGESLAEEKAIGRIIYQYRSDGTSPFPQYPAQTVAYLPKAWFTDKYVLIGTDLPYVDQHPTPMASLAGSEAGTLTGIEVHATILAQQLSGRSLGSASFLNTIALMVLAGLAASFGFLVIARPLTYFTLLFLAIGAYLLAAWMLVSLEILLLPVLGPPAAAVWSALIMALMRWRKDRSERVFLKTAFSKYVSPALVKRLTSGDISLKLGGEKRPVTYLFTDLQGFTSLSETLPPEQMAELLNSYLDRICDLATEHGATIDKIIGDAVVCFFGAPDVDPDQASRALELSLALDTFCESFRADANDRSIALGVTRIGIHHGEAVIGNFGGSRFFDYTGIGDTVNTAARLEGANKFLGTRICVSSAVASECPGHHFRPLGDLVLKGRSQPVACFEPVSDQDLSSAWMQAYLAAYQKMSDASPDALSCLESVAALKPGDGPTQLHIERLRDGSVGTKVTLSGK